MLVVIRMLSITHMQGSLFERRPKVVKLRYLIWLCVDTVEIFLLWYVVSVNVPQGVGYIMDNLLGSDLSLFLCIIKWTPVEEDDLLLVCTWSV